MFFTVSPALAFIGCSPRSGSTLLIRILNSHSKIAAPCEIALPRYFMDDAEKEHIVNEKYQQICQYYHVDENRALRKPKHLFKTILNREKKALLVLKDPRQSLFLSHVAHDYPKAKFIHLVRDARSVAMSTMFAHQPKRGLQRWFEYNQAVIRVTQALPARQWHLIRYEDMLNEPNETLSRLVIFLGFHYEPTMLHYGRFQHADDKMQLWGGKTPQQSHLHHALQLGELTPAIKTKREDFSQNVLQAYHQQPDVVKLNTALGYV